MTPRFAIALLCSLASLHAALAQFGCANWVSQGPVFPQDSDSSDNLSNGVDAGYAGASTLHSFRTLFFYSLFFIENPPTT
jgi:hypothetical protein